MGRKRISRSNQRSMAMTASDEIKRRIELKRQLIKITRQEIRDLEKKAREATA
jgi:hypothetical protein